MLINCNKIEGDNMKKLRNTPNLTMETIKAMEDMTYFTHALIFDDLLIVAQRETACFVWKTSEGLAIIDGIWPCKDVYDAVINAIKDVGWNPDDICKMFITHGHLDHTGCGKWFVENHHVETFLSKIDDVFWQEHPVKPDRPETWKDFDIHTYINDGECIKCGDKSLYVYATPGHTPGCMSFIFQVKDGEDTHMAALFGGETPPWTDIEGTKQFLKSVDYFVEVAKQKHVDVALSNHTAFDQGLDRIAYSKDRLAYMPNIYVLGEEGFEKFCSVFQNLGESVIKQNS